VDRSAECSRHSKRPVAPETARTLISWCAPSHQLPYRGQRDAAGSAVFGERPPDLAEQAHRTFDCASMRAIVAVLDCPGARPSNSSVDDRARPPCAALRPGCARPQLQVVEPRSLRPAIDEHELGASSRPPAINARTSRGPCAPDPMPASAASRPDPDRPGLEVRTAGPRAAAFLGFGDIGGGPSRRCSGILEPVVALLGVRAGTRGHPARQAHPCASTRRSGGRRAQADRGKVPADSSTRTAESPE
jgi:hypothetical protein